MIYCAELSFIEFYIIINYNNTKWQIAWSILCSQLQSGKIV